MDFKRNRLCIFDIKMKKERNKAKRNLHEMLITHIYKILKYINLHKMNINIENQYY